MRTGGRAHGFEAARAAAVLAIALGTCAVPGSSASASEPGPSPRPRSVAAMGDSLTDPRVGGGKYLEALRKLCPESRFDSYGRGGEMVNQMERRFAREILARGPEREPYTDVIVFGGVNDLYSDLTAGRTFDRITGDLSKMYRAARSRGLRVIAVTIAPWGGFKRYFNASRAAATLRVNDWIRSRLDEGEVDAVVDAHALLSCGDPEVLCERLAKPFTDGIHFGPEGHQKLGRAIHDAAFRDCR